MATTSQLGKIVVEVNFRAFLNVHRLLNDGVTRQAMNEELNSFASKATTQVRRHLAHQTLLPYSYMVDKVTLKRSWSAALEARIQIKDKATSLGRFMTSYRNRPKSWRKKGWQQKMRLRVWSGSQVFPRNPNAKPFVIDGGRATPLIAVRRTKARTPIIVLSGPVLAGTKENTGEVSRLETKTYIDIQMPAAMIQSIEDRIDRLMAKYLTPTP
jgi:hypothetical protein